MQCITAKLLKNGDLTNKEAEVLRYLCEGYYRPEIALKLHRTLSTVSTHVEHIADKLNARSTTEIVIIAEKLGLVEIVLIRPEQHCLLNSLLIILMVCELFNPMGRKPPKKPRQSVRVVRHFINPGYRT